MWLFFLFLVSVCSATRGVRHRLNGVSPRWFGEISRNRSKFLVRVCKKGQRVTRGGPGWAGPALTGFFVEPFPLDFWKLEKSFSLSRPSRLFAWYKSHQAFCPTFQTGHTASPLAVSQASMHDGNRLLCDPFAKLYRLSYTRCPTLLSGS